MSADYRYIDDFSIGDTYKVLRNVDAFPEGQLITDAFWTIKENQNDIDEEALLAIHITEFTSGSGIGAITNYADGASQLLFIAQPAASFSMSPSATYFYDIHINLDSGEKYMVEYGKLFTLTFVTHSH